MSGKTERKGSCLCGTVKVTIPALEGHIGVCHCGMCQRWGGGPLLAIEAGDGVRFQGEDSIAVYASSDWAERGFCSKCGSHLFYRLKQGGLYAIPAGLLDDVEGLDLTQQIFIDQKPAYYEFANATRNLTGAEVFAEFGAAPE